MYADVRIKHFEAASPSLYHALLWPQFSNSYVTFKDQNKCHILQLKCNLLSEDSLSLPGLGRNPKSSMSAEQPRI